MAKVQAKKLSGKSHTASPPATVDNEVGWFDRDQMAAIFGVNTKSFDSGQRKLLPTRGDHVKTVNRRPLFLAHAYVQAWHRRELDKVTPDVPADPMFVGGGSDSPNLERYRLAKAQQVEMELAVRRGQLMPTDWVREGYGQVASLVRSLGENLQRKYGAGALRMLNNTLDKADESFERFFKNRKTHGSPDTPDD